MYHNQFELRLHNLKQEWLHQVSIIDQKGQRGIIVYDILGLDPIVLAELFQEYLIPELEYCHSRLSYSSLYEAYANMMDAMTTAFQSLLSAMHICIQDVYSRSMSRPELELVRAFCSAYIDNMFCSRQMSILKDTWNAYNNAAEKIQKAFKRYKQTHIKCTQKMYV